MQRCVLVTGATSGIGQAATRALDEAGWSVWATARRDEDLERLAAAGLDPVRLDLTDPKSIETAAETVAREAEGLHGLVHNAGVGVLGAVEDLTPEAWRHQFEVNLFGPIELTRQLMPTLERGATSHERGARIVLVSSLAGEISLPLYGAYCASKHALEAVGDALRTEVADRGIHVSLVQPGPVGTGFQQRSGELLERYAETEDSPHAAAYDRLAGALLESGPTVPVERVARAIGRALKARNPRARYPVGRLTSAAVGLAGALPTGVRDRAVRWYMDL